MEQGIRQNLPKISRDSPILSPELIQMLREALDALEIKEFSLDSYPAQLMPIIP